MIGLSFGKAVFRGTDVCLDALRLKRNLTPFPEEFKTDLGWKARVNSMAKVSTRQCNKKKELLQNYTFLILKECTAESIFHLYNYLDEGCTQKTFLSLIRSTGHQWIARYQVLDILQAKSWSMPFIRTDHWHVTLAQMNKYEGWLHKVETYSTNLIFIHKDPQLCLVGGACLTIATVNNSLNM